MSRVHARISGRQVWRDPVGQTFSDVWYRVSPTRPRLSVHARFVRQRHGPTVSYVVEDPAGGHYYRVSESARFFVGMLDGHRTAEDAWRACLAQLGDEAPTQKECLELLAQLQLFGLLAGEQPLDPSLIEERQRRFRTQRIRKRTGNWLFFHIPLFNPEPWLRSSAGLWRIVWGLPGALGLVALLGWAGFELVGHLDRLGSSLNAVLDPANLIWLGVLFLGIRLLHELGHATACKAMGGRCTEIGVMMIAFILPLPYCDASSSWRFPETWKRVLVACGGMIVEIALAAVAVLVWAASEPGLARTLGFNVMIISGVTTLLFNINPLLRYDGYYILCDLAGSPNLATRAKQLWHTLVIHRAYGARHTRAPFVRDAGEARLMYTYHALAVPYRLFIVLSILLIIMGQYLTVGLVLAAVFGFMWLVLPVLMGAWFLVSSPKLIGRRVRAIGVTAAVLGPIVAALALAPLPRAARAPAVIDWSSLTPVRAEASGYLSSVEVRPGESAESGQVVAVLSNPTLKAEALQAEARVRRAAALLRDAQARGSSEVRVAEIELRRAERVAQDLRRRVEALSITSPAAGSLAVPRGPGMALEQSIGRFVKQGEIIGFVLPEGDAAVLAVVTDAQAPLLLPTLSDGDETIATVRLRGSAEQAFEATVRRVWPAGTREIPTPALAASAGGDILQDPAEPNRALNPLTQIELEPVHGRDGALPAMLHGRRGVVRFELEPEALLPRLVRHARRLLDARAGV
ncbi:MAG: PqqD family peptide modification chaperone [Planctomycetota bacterium]